MTKAKITPALAAPRTAILLQTAFVGALAALTLAAQTLPVGAQDGGATGGLTTSLNLSERFEADSNASLAVVSPGTTLSSTTQLGFGLSSQTREESLGLNLSTALRMVGGPGATGDSVMIDDPRLTFSYSRSSANAGFGLNTNYRQSDIAFLRPLDDFLDENGNLVLPEDLSGLTGTGKRRDYGISASLNLGTEAPFGVSLNAGLKGLDYTDVSNPELFNNRRTNLGATARLRFSPVTDGTVGISQAVYDAQDTVETYRTTQTLSFGVTHKLSKTATLSATLGQTVVKTEELLSPTAKTEGVTGQIGFDFGLPNGNATADITSNLNQDGRRTGVNFGRSFKLPNGSINAGLGATQPDGGNLGMTASLAYSQDLAKGAFNVQFSRAVITGSDDSQDLATTLALGYSQQLGAQSRFGVNVSYSSSDASGTANLVNQASLGATYSHNLTPDWSLDVGYRYRMRDEETLDRAESQSVFLSLNRAFNLRP